MLKTLYLLRHAKTEQGLLKPDEARALTERGWRESRAMGLYLESEGIRPDRILCSPAVRARETLQGLMEHWHSDAEVLYDRSLYLPTPSALKEVLEIYEEESLFIVSHNPGLEYFLQELSGSYHPLKTCHLAVIDYPRSTLTKLVSGRELASDEGDEAN